ncbi:efflux RND transporter permease subunit [Hyphococcus flavus]|uniref:Efflux RND transporter permease subunit n=1 Tax=Hyphococcus flavus TaxID=1866326 RepID=A0AAE9ZFJ4_9PROT|nr:efflux RND transporter permease subunit [Hyphococcus flavus]WDI31983.1 efflux RND transporter permease subunit [Hyphococcus flavus]
MGLTRICLKNPAAAGVVLAIITLLGFMSISQLPVQLFPAIERPQIGVWTGWRAASPREVESEITEPVERELRGIPGMTAMQSWSNPGGAWINLEFALGTDMDQAFTEVNSRLQRVRGLPAEAERPRVNLGGGGGNSGETLIFLFLQKLPSNTNENVRLSEFAEQRIAPTIEAINGVAGIDINSDDGEMIVNIEFDPFLAAQLGITLDEITQNVNRSSDVTGGRVEVGRRNYTMRFEGRFSAEQLNETILAWRDGAPVTLGDIAEVKVAPDHGGGVVYQNGNPAIGMRVIREPGANTLEAIDELTVVLDELNAGALADMGYAIHKSFDPSVFIKRAISLLTSNLLIGVMLAVGALWLFLRRTMATVIIAAAIPICLMATIVVLNLFGRTINVISLAGLAFATGMVLDAAIVVLENFVRMREEGHSSYKAAENAVGQVFGALFASTVTTIAIFIPIMFFEDIEGQLFADLALTIAIAVSCSLLVAVTLLPTGARLFIKESKNDATGKRPAFASKLANFIMGLTATNPRRIGIVAGLTIVPIVLGYLLWPQLNYLPPVKRDAVDAMVGFPSGASADMIREEFAEVVVERLEPYLTGEKEPALRNYYMFSGEWGGNVGIRVRDQSRVQEMIKIANEEILSGFPDTRVFANQGSLFGNWGGQGSIRLELQAADFDALGNAVPQAIEIIQQTMPGAQVWPNPDPQIVTPELRLLPNDRRIAEVGMTRDSVSRAVRALGDGQWLGEFFHQDGRIDIYLRAKEWTEPEYLETAPIATPTGAIVPLGELVTISRGVGPQQIRRLDARRTITLGITPPDGIALGPAVELLKDVAEPQLYETLPQGSSLKWGGDADALARAVKNLGGNFLLAIAILFLIMAALFKSVKDAFFVIVTLPMATVGGILAIRGADLLNPLPLDLLGMIGFIILLGLVVNNAILLVSQTRASEAEGKSRAEAVREALTLRIRPIFMSTSTSLMGMLPLVLAPGAGSLIYRGLATVIVGGMAVSTLFTLILLPAMLQLGAAPALAKTRGGLAAQPAE